LPEPIAIGVGLHAGNVILGELGYRDRFLLTAIGDSVHVAARLQELTKDYGCQLVVSNIVAATAGVEMTAFPVREVSVRGRTEPLAVSTAFCFCAAVLGGSMLTRRHIFVGGVASLICAPAIVRAESLMPIRALIVPMQPVHAGFVERLRFHCMEQLLKNGWTTERARTFGGISEKRGETPSHLCPNARVVGIRHRPGLKAPRNIHHPNGQRVAWCCVLGCTGLGF
jgi:hypothetical protein